MVGQPPAFPRSRHPDKLSNTASASSPTQPAARRSHPLGPAHLHSSIPPGLVLLLCPSEVPVQPSLALQAAGEGQCRFSHPHDLRASSPTRHRWVARGRGGEVFSPSLPPHTFSQRHISCPTPTPINKVSSAGCPGEVQGSLFRAWQTVRGRDRCNKYSLNGCFRWS